MSKECKPIYTKKEICTTTFGQSGHRKLNSLIHCIRKPAKIKAGQPRRLSIRRLTKIHKNTERWHERKILLRQYLPGQKVLLFNSRLKRFPDKLKSRWSSPFKVAQVSPSGAITIKSLKDDHEFDVNGQRLKSYMGVHTQRDNGLVVLGDA
ncbi:hypothetical protein GQ457_13G014030 [Hibiscus cannabinus]